MLGTAKYHARFALVAAALTAAICLSPMAAVAQSSVADNYSDLSATAEHYAKEREAALKTCDSTRYARAVRGLRGLREQIDQDIAGEQARLKRMEEAAGSIVVAAFTNAREYRQYRDEVQANIRYLRRRIADLDKLRDRLDAVLNKGAAFRSCPGPATAAGRGMTPEDVWGYTVLMGVRRLQVSVGAEVGGVGGFSGFNVVPDFGVPGSGAVGGVYMDVRSYVTPTMFFGGRGGVQFSGNGGARFYNATAHEYRVEIPTMGYVEGTIGVKLGGGTEVDLDRTARARASALLDAAGWILQASAGLAVADSRVHAQNLLGGTAFDSNIALGITTSFGVEVPVTDSLFLTGTGRFTHLFERPYAIPGAVDISSDIFSATVGVRYQLK